MIGPFRTIHWSGVHVTGEVGIALQPIAAVGRRYRGGPVLGPKPTRGVSGLGPHTGCWAASVAIGSSSLGKPLVALGYTCVCTSHRLANEAGWQAQIQDLETWIRWI
jgi:acetyl esterase/lipase